MELCDQAVRHKASKSSGNKNSGKNNIVFRCNYCDGGESHKTVGYKGVCSDEVIRYNINTAKNAWCSRKESMCYRYLQSEISREELKGYYNRTKGDLSRSVCYESQMLEIWNAGAFFDLDGSKKGRTVPIRNVKAGNLAVLTSILPQAEEENRFIFAVFLIDETCRGDNTGDGYIAADPKYRVQLSLKEAEELKFRDYYYDSMEPENIFVGGGQFLYFTDIQSAQVLKRICEIKKGTPEGVLAREFTQHFCRLKKLDIEEIPSPAGALCRIWKNEL